MRRWPYLTEVLKFKMLSFPCCPPPPPLCTDKLVNVARIIFNNIIVLGVNY